MNEDRTPCTSFEGRGGAEGGGPQWFRCDPASRMREENLRFRRMKEGESSLSSYEGGEGSEFESAGGSASLLSGIMYGGNPGCVSRRHPGTSHGAVVFPERCQNFSTIQLSISRSREILPDTLRLIRLKMCSLRLVLQYTPR